MISMGPCLSAVGDNNDAILNARSVYTDPSGALTTSTAEFEVRRYVGMIVALFPDGRIEGCRACKSRCTLRCRGSITDQRRRTSEHELHRYHGQAHGKSQVACRLFGDLRIATVACRACRRLSGAPRQYVQYIEHIEHDERARVVWKRRLQEINYEVRGVPLCAWVVADAFATRKSSLCRPPRSARAHSVLCKRRAAQTCNSTHNVTYMQIRC